MKKFNEFFNYAIVATIVLFAGVFYLESKPKTTVSSDLDPADVDQIVNKFIKQTSDQNLKEDIAFKSALQQELRKPLNVKMDEPGPKPEDIPADKQIWKDTQTPAENVYSEIYNKELIQKQDEFTRAEYARQFIENARNNGFHVVLSSDLKVLSVTPIRKPSQDDDSKELFPAD